LFDIDGTILNAGAAGKDAFMEAAMLVFGTAGAMQNVDFQGRTDRYIIEESFKHSSVTAEELKAKTELMKRSYIESLRKTIHEHESVLLPGVRELIQELYADEKIILGLLTGNFMESAFIKLARFGLEIFFHVGAYGEDAIDRSELPPIAKKRIAEHKGIELDFSRIIIIGDTVHDIECARKSGAVSISVGTGWTHKEKLLEKNPDYCLDNLADTQRVLELITSI
ncbi:MAG: HAD hydrolase-like protein, partial [Spirochaetia bacterium]|nr:HAD hydrolase-like protein [Spirochaetia bacterium]